MKYLATDCLPAANFHDLIPTAFPAGCLLRIVGSRSFVCFSVFAKPCFRLAVATPILGGLPREANYSHR